MPKCPFLSSYLECYAGGFGSANCFHDGYHCGCKFKTARLQFAETPPSAARLIVLSEITDFLSSMKSRAVASVSSGYSYIYQPLDSSSSHHAQEKSEPAAAGLPSSAALQEADSDESALSQLFSPPGEQPERNVAGKTFPLGNSSRPSPSGDNLVGDTLAGDNSLGDSPDSISSFLSSLRVRPVTNRHIYAMSDLYTSAAMNGDVKAFFSAIDSSDRDPEKHAFLRRLPSRPFFSADLWEIGKNL